jgi:hypothetical protein
MAASQTYKGRHKEVFLSCFSSKKLKTLTSKTLENMKKETWKFILQTIASILTAIATTLGVTSCI